MIVETAITTHSRITTFSQSEKQRLPPWSHRGVDLKEEGAARVQRKSTPRNKWLTRNSLHDRTCRASMIGNHKWREIKTYTYIKYSETKVVSEQRMKGNEVSAVSFRLSHFAHLSPGWNVPHRLLAVSWGRHRCFCSQSALSIQRLSRETGSKDKKKTHEKKEFTVCIPSVTALLTRYITGLVFRFTGPQGALLPSSWVCSFQWKHGNWVSEVLKESLHTAQKTSELSEYSRH